MLLRFIFWLLHRHEWIDFKTDPLVINQGTVGTIFFQKCSHKYCQRYRSQKIMASATLQDYSR